MSAVLRRRALAAVVVCSLAVLSALPTQATAREVVDPPGSSPSPIPSTAMSPGRVDCAVPGLPAETSGTAALAATEGRTASVAASNGVSVDQLAGILRADRTARLDGCGRLRFVEPAVVPAGAGTAATTADAVLPVTGAGLSTSGDAFALHSRPGSSRTIYLDFTGRTLVGTVWNQSTGRADLDLPAYDTDGSTSFGAAERAVVVDTWLQVAEDYAPFDVDVTTQDPGQDALDRTTTNDQRYGTRALVTSADTATVQLICGGSCGGVAYISVFDRTGSNHDYYQPALVFARMLGASGKSVGEAAAHEVGHNLGLVHQGIAGGATYYSGQGPWAPIMGVGYSRPLSQWAKGEYLNPSSTQDELAVMATRGVVAAADDHASASAGATPVSPGVPVEGLVGVNGDQDWFRFDASGPTTVGVTTQRPGADLDVRLDLYTADGSLLQSADPTAAMTSSTTATGLDASITTTLPAGGYLARVSGTGAGSPTGAGYTAYGSLGRYTVVLSTDLVTNPPTSTTSTTSTTSSTSTATTSSTTTPATTTPATTTPATTTPATTTPAPPPTTPAGTTSPPGPPPTSPSPRPSGTPTSPGRTATVVRGWPTRPVVARVGRYATRSISMRVSVVPASGRLGVVQVAMCRWSAVGRSIVRRCGWRAVSTVRFSAQRSATATVRLSVRRGGSATFRLVLPATAVATAAITRPLVVRGA